MGKSSDEEAGLDETLALISDEQLGEFLSELFKEYSMVVSRDGRPLLNNHALRQFFKAFVKGPPEDIIAKADECYSLEMQRQMDASWHFDLTKVDAKRGLCLSSFLILLNNVFVGGFGHRLGRERFLEFHGSAKL